MSNAVIALDVGEKRIGVAIAAGDTSLAYPHMTIENDDQAIARLQSVVDEHKVKTVVIGYPRNMDGDATAQTRYCTAFGDIVGATLDVSVIYQDESLTSQKAEAELEARGKPYTKGEIDALAATYILEDYLQSKSGGNL